MGKGTGSWGEGLAVEGMSPSTVSKGKSSRKASLFTCCFMTTDGMSLLAGSTPSQCGISISSFDLRAAADSVLTVDQHHQEGSTRQAFE